MTAFLSRTGAAVALSPRAVLVLTVVLAGCASPGESTPTRALRQAENLSLTATRIDWPDARWWTAYGDERLDALVEQALAGQPGLHIARARLAQAEAGAGLAASTGQPQLNASVDLSDQRFTRNGMIPAPLAGSTAWNNNAQVTATWELDLFGRQRAALDAAIGQQRAQAAELQAARVLLASQVAATYVQLARLVEVRDVAIVSQQQREQVLALVRQRAAAGLDSTVELRQSEGLVAQSRAEIEATREQVERARHALAELCGQPPGALAGLEPHLAPVRSLPLPEGLPADLLGRRADLLAQRWRVEAAVQDIAAARAQFHPNVNLVAFVGLSSLGLDRLLESGARTSGVGPALRLPLFDGGRLRAQLDSRRAEADAAIEAYNQTLLRALREVADETASLRSIEAQQHAQRAATEAAEAAFDFAVQRYRAGLGNFMTVLTAELNLLAQRRAAIDLKARHLGSEVALARALGGGYEATLSDHPDTGRATVSPPSAS